MDPQGCRRGAPPGGRAGKLPETLFPEQGQLKVFIRGGSSLTADLTTRKAVYESIRKRPLLSSMNRLHYNPSRWWTVFSDVFLASLVVIVVSGLVMLRGPKGLWGRGGIELLAGILIPVLFMFFCLTTESETPKKGGCRLTARLLPCDNRGCYALGGSSTSRGMNRKSPKSTMPAMRSTRLPGGTRRRNTA